MRDGTAQERTPEDAAGSPSLPASFILSGVRFYQRVISPRKGGPTCRFTPTCSEYAAQAVTKHGALRGSVMAALRVLRCHPFHPGGHDPVK